MAPMVSRLRWVVGLVALVAGLVVSVSLAPQAGAATDDFSGTADSAVAGLRWQTFEVQVTGLGELVATLSWSDPSADLKLFLRDRGVLSAADTSTRNPKTLRYQVEPGTYQVHVKAKSGRSPFTLSVDTPDGGAEQDQDLVFDGSGAAGGPSWLTHTFFAESGRVRIELDWDDPNADLSMFLRNPAGDFEATVLDQSRPKVIQRSLYEGTFKVHVKVRSGATDYRVRVSFLDQNPGSSGVISGRVWSDVDGDGIQDTGEPGIAGADLALWDEAGQEVGGHPISTAVDGSYRFEGLPAGTYRMVLYDPGRLGQISPQDRGGDDTRDSDVNLSPSVGGGNLYPTDPVTLAEGQSIDHLDAGIIEPVLTPDQTWTGTAPDGGLSWLSHPWFSPAADRVTVELTWADPSADLALFVRERFTGSTDPGTLRYFNGTAASPVKTITFTASPNREYRIHVKARSGATDYTVRVFSEGAPLAQTTLFTGRVWDDLDGDGIQDPGEPGRAGVLYYIQFDQPSPSDGAGDFTDADGRIYLPISPEPGNTGRLVVRSPGPAFSLANVGADDTVDSDVVPTGQNLEAASATVSLAAGTQVIDAGLALGSPTASAPPRLVGGLADVDGDSWITHRIPVTETGPASFTLRLDDPDAQVRVFLRHPVTRALVASSPLGGGTMTHTLDVTGNWLVHVYAKGGRSTYTVEVDIPGGVGVGYLTTYSDRAGGPAYSAESPSNPTTDDVDTRIDLPFTFPLDGFGFDSVRVDEDGLLAFGEGVVPLQAGQAGYFADEIGGVVAALWADVEDSSMMAINTFEHGWNAAGTAYLIEVYVDSYTGGPGAPDYFVGDAAFTYELRPSGTVLVHYDSVDSFYPAWRDGVIGAVGIESPDGSGVEPFDRLEPKKFRQYTISYGQRLNTGS